LTLRQYTNPDTLCDCPLLGNRPYQDKLFSN
jgi:hypothetical protein